MSETPEHLNEELLFEMMEQMGPLTAEQRQSVIAMNVVRRYRKGALLLKEGQYSDSSFLILRGCLRVYYLMDGVEKTTAFYTESESFSPACVVNQHASAYYVSCVEDCILTVVTTGDLEQLFEKFPQLEQGCRGRTEQALVDKQTALDELRSLTAEQLYLNLMQTRPDLLQRVPQYQIASYLGITPQSLSRLRARMRENV